MDMRPGHSQCGAGESPAVETVTAAECDAFGDLLAAVDLDRDALVALNMCATQAEVVLTALRNWHATAQHEVTACQARVAARFATIRQLERNVRAGRADDRAAAETAWQTAQAAILTQDNLQIMTAYNDCAAGAADALTQAIDAVMPLAGDVG